MSCGSISRGYDSMPLNSVSLRRMLAMTPAPGGERCVGAAALLSSSAAPPACLFAMDLMVFLYFSHMLFSSSTFSFKSRLSTVSIWFWCCSMASVVLSDFPSTSNFCFSSTTCCNLSARFCKSLIVLSLVAICSLRILVVSFSALQGGGGSEKIFAITLIDQRKKIQFRFNYKIKRKVEKKPEVQYLWVAKSEIKGNSCEGWKEKTRKYDGE